MGAVFGPKKLSRKPRKKISHDSIKDILPNTSENSEEK
jgi:hypothetical protein